MFSRIRKRFTYANALWIASSAVLLCACIATLLLGGPSRASAAPSAPVYLGEIVGAETPTGELLDPESAAVEDASGDVYVGMNKRLVEFSPYGAFIREIGGEVDQSKAEERTKEEAAKEALTVTKEEEDICTAASGDTCGEGERGSGTGQLVAVPGVAVEQSTGAVYVASGDRVDKFAKSGGFVYAIGTKVDATKVDLREKEEAAKEAVTVTKEEEDICTAASGDECQKGESGSGAGEFETEVKALAVGGPDGKEQLYVGNKARVQVFNGAGHQVGEDSLSSLSASGQVEALTADATGDLFLAVEGVAGVHEVEPGGAVSSNVYDSASTSVEALAVDQSGHLFVGDKSPSWRVLEYEVASPSGTPTEFADSEPGKLEATERAYGLGLAVDGAGTVYAVEYAREGRVLMFGSLAAMESSYGAPGIKPAATAETVAAIPGSGEATLQAEVNPQFAATTYQFQYGTEPCSSGHCTSVPASPAPLGVLTKTLHPVSATVSGLQVGHLYYLRTVATDAAGTTDGVEVLFTPASVFEAAAPGLPDGRRYELVSPPDKDGNQVYPNEELQFYSVAAEDGNGILFEGSGAMGEANSAVSGSYVATRSSAGWSTQSAIPPVTAGQSLFGPTQVIPSKSLSKFLFEDQFKEYGHEVPLGPEGSVNIFLAEAPGAEPLWLGKPAISDPFPAPGHTYVETYQIDGASSDLGIVYFSALGTLVPEDEARAKHIGQAKGEGKEGNEPWGFYEWHDGVLSPAGVLPDGGISEWGAVPPHIAKEGFSRKDTPDYFNNQVSEDGSKAFFMSPDPSASFVTAPSINYPDNCSSELKNCTSEAPELYVRETLPDGTKRTVLISQSQLPGQEGRPAPDGPLRFEDPVSPPHNEEGPDSESYIYATPDGKQAFFYSVDRLTSAAPSNREPKMYDFDTETETLTYLPGVDGSIAAVAPNGSDFIFEDKSQSPYELKLWTAGPDGGSVRPVAQLPTVESASREEQKYDIDNARASQDGSVFAFGTNAQIPGGFNDGGGFWQMYRYSVSGGELNCVSCPPHAQAPIGNAEASYADSVNTGLFGALSTINTRVLSSNGERVFFDTPNALVPQATNGKDDVYEWENGKVYLISSGSSSANAYIMDSSASGNDVFFSTSAGLVPQDTDGAYDVYDARVPHPGDEPPPVAVPCEGSVCQGPASSPQLLSPPASESFSGAGNLSPLATKNVSPVKKAKRKPKEKRKKPKRKPKEHVGKKARRSTRADHGSHDRGGK